MTSAQFRSQGSIALLLAIVCVFFFACFAPIQSAHGQGLKVTQPPPNCHLFESRYDNPFDDTHNYKQPAILWHAEYAFTSYALAWSLDKVTGHRMPQWLTAGVVITSIGVVPHIRGGFIRRDYPINPLDMTYDLVNRATPAVWAAGGDTTKSFMQNHGKAFAIWLVSDLALSCFASP